MVVAVSKAGGIGVLGAVGYSPEQLKEELEWIDEHIGDYPVIIISPTDSNLILEGSDTRRKYLDSSISLFQKSYLCRQTFSNYQQLI